MKKNGLTADDKVALYGCFGIVVLFVLKWLAIIGAVIGVVWLVKELLF